MDVGELPRDLDGWPYRAETDIGPWKVSPCCGAFVEWNNTGVGPVVLICKRCYAEVPDGFRDEPPRLAEPCGIAECDCHMHALPVDLDDQA